MWLAQLSPRNWTLWLVLGLTAAGAYLRFYALSVPSLWIDEGFSVVTARAILEHGRPLLPGGETAWSYLPAHYLMALGLTLFDDLEFGARYFPCLAGVLLIPAFYFLNRQVFQSRAQALAATVLLTFLAYEVGWSRQARGYVILQLFMVLAIACYYRFLDRPNAKQLWLAALFTALALLSHRAGYLVPLILALATVLGWKDAKTGLRWAVRNKTHTLGILVVGVAFVVMLARLATNSGLTGAIENVTAGGQLGYLPMYGSLFFAQFKGVLVWALLGAGLAAWKRPTRALPLLIAGAAYVYVIAYRNFLFHYRYALPIIFLFPLFAGYAFSYLLEQCLSLKGRSRGAATVVLVLLFAGSMMTGRYVFRPQTRHYLGFTSPMPNWEAAYQWVLQDYRPASREETGPVTMSAFPMFHDLYLGTNAGRKYFMPFNISGYPGDDRMDARYSEAEVVSTAQQLSQLHGYVVLDDFGLRMLKDQETQRLFMSKKPDQIIDGPRRFDVYIWRL